MDEISQGPKWDFRLPSGRWLTHRWLIAAATATVLVVAAALAVTGIGGHRGARPPRPAGVPGTFLLTCDSANWNQLNPDWRSSSLRVGPLWFVDSSQSGYVRYGRPAGTAGTFIANAGPSDDAVMLLEVAAGSTVVMKAASGTQPYFRFFTGFGAGTAYPLPAPLPSGDTGYTFVACPRQQAGPNGQVTDFLLGFSIDTGRTAPVEIWTPASPCPVWVTFAAPARALPTARPSVSPTGRAVASCSPSTGACSVRIP